MSTELKLIDSKVVDALRSADSQEFVKKILNERASSFITSMVSVVSASPELQRCTPQSILGACLKAAALNLPIEPSLGLAYIVPFSGTATFMLGWKGYIQLALRTGQYKKINVVDVRVGEIVEIDHFTETYTFAYIQDDVKRQKSPICGYFATFELTNGYKKELYWSIEKLLTHGKKYSKSFNFGAWRSNQDEMCKKTLIKQLLSKWGILSIEMTEALKSDGATIEYDSEGNENVNFESNINSAIDAEIIEPDAAEDEYQEVISKDEK